MPNLKRGKASYKMKAKKRQRMLYNVLIFVAVWLASTLVIGIIGACFANAGTIHPLFVVALIVIPIVLSIFTILPAKKKRTKSKTIRPTRTTMPTPQADIHAKHCTRSSAQLVPDKQKNDNTKTYRVTGTEHYKNSILNLALENDDYIKTKRELIDDLLTEERIWKFSFYPSKVDLVPEPDNPYDPNAIKVIVDNEHIGYIKKGSCNHLLKVIAEGRLGNIDCAIGGGPYKFIHEDYDDYGNEKYELECDEVGFSVILHIKEDAPPRRCCYSKEI